MAVISRRKGTRRRARNPAAVAFPYDASAAQREAQAARTAILSSAAFRRWFGRSHVVDARGEPLVVYHGTKAREAFTVFRRPRFEDYGEDENPGVGIYFTDDPKTAASYGSVYPVYLRILNPLVVDGKGQEWGDLVFEGHRMYPDDIVSIAEERGHDGVIIRNVYDNYGAQDVQSDVYVVFEPTQIKSATGNEGTFDAADPDIRHNPRMRALSRRAPTRPRPPALATEPLMNRPLRRPLRRRRNPDAPFRFPSGAEAEQAALAARPAVLADPEFQSWFGRSQVVDAKGQPLVVYHGTNSRDAFTEFSDEDAPDRGGLIAFFSSSPAFAQGYGKHVYPVYLRCYDVFDFRDTGLAESAVGFFYDDHGGIRDDYEARRILMGLTDTHPEFANLNDISDTRYDASDLTKKLFLEAVLVGSWDALEANEFVEYLREGWGCDGIVLLEGGAINYGIFEAEDVKSATANNGDYDGGDPDILANPRTRAPTSPRPRKAPRRLRRNPEDRGYVRDLLARLQEFKENVMEAAEVDPYETSFDPMDYPIDDSTLQAYLDAPVLGWGASRVVVRLPSGNVAKLPWSDAYEANEREWDNWNEASEASSEVQEMLLPPLEYISGVLVFPHAKTVHHLDYDDPMLAAAREKWKRLWSAGAPGANAQDFQNTQNWGIYDGRVVLLDYAD